MTTNTVLITGCSSGIGKITANTFQDRGWNVVATMRSPDKESELSKLKNTLVTRLDVTDQGSISQAIDAGLEAFGKIDALVNNAGYGGHALLEQTTDKTIREMYETNVFGVMNTCRAVLPLMRKQGAGHIINVTSMGGMMGLPLDTVYCSSKFAVEGLTEALALECKPLNIIARSVAPGAYLTTEFTANVDQEDMTAGSDDLVGYARKLREHFQNVVSNGGNKTQDPQEVADVIYACATTDMPVHNPVGQDAEMLVGLMGIAPRQNFLDQMEKMLLPQA